MVRRWRKRRSHSREAEWCSHRERQFGSFLWSKTVLKNHTARYWHTVMEETLERPLNIKEIQPVHPKGDRSWIFTGRTDAEAGAPVHWPPDAKNWLLGKDPDAGKDGRQEKGTTEDEMLGWHHWLDGHSVSKLRDLVMHREAWRAAVHGVAKSWTRLSHWTTIAMLAKVIWKRVSTQKPTCECFQQLYSF